MLGADQTYMRTDTNRRPRKKLQQHMRRELWALMRHLHLRITSCIPAQGRKGQEMRWGTSGSAIWPSAIISLESTCPNTFRPHTIYYKVIELRKIDKEMHLMRTSVKALIGWADLKISLYISAFEWTRSIERQLKSIHRERSRYSPCKCDLHV